MTDIEKKIIADFFIQNLIRCLTEESDTLNMHFDSDRISFDAEITFTNVKVNELS